MFSMWCIIGLISYFSIKYINALHAIVPKYFSAKYFENYTFYENFKEIIVNNNLLTIFLLNLLFKLSFSMFSKYQMGLF